MLKTEFTTNAFIYNITMTSEHLSEILKRELPFLGPDPLESWIFKGGKKNSKGDFMGKKAPGMFAIGELYDVIGVLGGGKPIALVSVLNMTRRRNREQITKTIDLINGRELCVMVFKIEWRHGTIRDRVVAYLPENRDRALKCIYVRAKFDADNEGRKVSERDSSHLSAKIGYLLGYLDENIISYNKIDADVYYQLKAEVDQLKVTQDQIEEIIGSKIITLDELPLNLFVSETNC